MVSEIQANIPYSYLSSLFGADALSGTGSSTDDSLFSATITPLDTLSLSGTLTGDTTLTSPLPDDLGISPQLLGLLQNNSIGTDPLTRLYDSLFTGASGDTSFTSSLSALLTAYGEANDAYSQPTTNQTFPSTAIPLVA